MKKEKGEVNKTPDLCLIPKNLIQYCGFNPMFLLTSFKDEKTTLIPRHVVTHIQVFPIITQDMRMSISRYQRRYPPSITGSQHDMRAISDSQIVHDTDLHEAARSGSVSKAQELLGRNKELVKFQDAQGSLPLHLAVQTGNKMVAMYLVEEYPLGSYVSNVEGLSPLYLAVVGKQLEVAELMLQKLASDRELVSKLKRGKSIVHAAIITHDKEMLEMILKHQPELMETYDTEGLTPLSCAAYNGFADLVKFFLKKSPEPKAKIIKSNQDKDLSHAVHKASVRGHIEVLKVFYKYNHKLLLLGDRYGRTTLHVAAEKPLDKLKNVVSYLVGLHEIREKLICRKDENDCTALDLAMSSKNHQIVEILKHSN